MKKLLLFLIIPFLSFGQVVCIEGEFPNCYGEIKKNDKGEYWKGDFNEARPWNGNGKLIYENENTDDSWFEGEWKNGKWWNGNGKIIHDDYWFEGEWKNGKEWNGKIDIDEYDGFKFNGKWKNGSWFSGNLTQYDYNGELHYDGKVENGEYWTGNLFIEGCHNRQKIKFLNGKRNDWNYYILDDVSEHKSNSTTIHLRREDDGKNNLNNTFYVTLKYGHYESEWVFDTGAETFSTSQVHWDTIKQYIPHTVLNICKNVSGVGGKSYSNLVRLDEIQIGEYIVKNVIMGVSDSNYSLLGISFFEKFTNVKWNMKNEQLIIYK